MAITNEERRLQVGRMCANFAQEGQVPDADDKVLLERYIDGTASLSDLYHYACAFAVAAQEKERQKCIMENLPPS